MARLVTGVPCLSSLRGLYSDRRIAQQGGIGAAKGHGVGGYVTGLPDFLAYFAIGAALLASFAIVYSRVTPQREFSLIASGNSAAATAFLGALLGFAMPLASAAAHSVSLADFVIWALIGAAIQLLAFGAAALAQPRLASRITEGELSAGLWAGGISLVTGLLNAACMTW